MAVPRAPRLYYTTGHDRCRLTDGHVLGWRRTPWRLRRFLGRQTVPKGPTAAWAATLHHIHGLVRLAQFGEKVGGHDLPPLGARITHPMMVRTMVDLGAMVFVSDGRSHGRGATFDVRGGTPYQRRVGVAPRDRSGVRSWNPLRRYRAREPRRYSGDVEDRAAWMASHVAPKGDRPDLAHLQAG
jgi:hypothetical protein